MKQTDEKGNPLTYLGGLEEPNPFELPKVLPDDVFFKSLEEPKQESKQQTAVEWLVKELNKETSLTSFVADCDDEYKSAILSIIQQAKEMEKKQIIDACGSMYSEKEMLDFSEWLSDNDWVYLPSKGYWVNEEQEELEESFTTKELFEQFKKEIR